MTRKEKRVQQLVKELLEKWVGPLGLEHWDIVVHWERHPQKDDEGYRYFMVEPLWQYLRADLWCYLPTVAPLSDEKIEKSILHELAHILVAEMENPERRDSEERVCTHLANAFLWTRAAALEGRL